MCGATRTQRSPALGGGAASERGVCTFGMRRSDCTTVPGEWVNTCGNEDLLGPLWRPTSRQAQRCPGESSARALPIRLRLPIVADHSLRLRLEQVERCEASAPWCDVRILEHRWSDHPVRPRTPSDGLERASDASASRFPAQYRLSAGTASRGGAGGRRMASIELT